MAEPPLPEDYVIMGDFNMVPESPEYCSFAGTRTAITAACRASARRSTHWPRSKAIRPESYSWMDPKDHGKRMHLDYCFVSCGLQSRLKSAYVDTQSVGSDHFPLWVEIGG